MPNVINAEAKFRLLAKLQEPEVLSDDQFLIDEGLRLLAAYRSIKDRASRRLAIDFVTQLAAVPEQPKPERIHPLNSEAHIAYSVRDQAIKGS